jgi:hypothetical protein
MEWIITYWIATTTYGVYWLIKHPSSRRGDDMENFTLIEAAAHIFPAGLLAWAFVPMMILGSIEFKRPKNGKETR